MKNDLTGSTFGRWKVLSNSGGGYWKCACRCGTIKEKVEGFTLKSGRSISCGCFQREWAAGMAGKYLKKHGLRKHRLYSVWIDMKKRCYSPNSTSYPWYGGKGITVCKRWVNNFLNFYHWAMDNGYEQWLQLDRINSSERYSPENCQWVTARVNAANRGGRFLGPGFEFEQECIIRCEG